MVDDMNFQVQICIMGEHESATWFSENCEFTLDYICGTDCD